MLKVMIIARLILDFAFTLINHIKSILNPITHDTVPITGEFLL